MLRVAARGRARELVADLAHATRLTRPQGLTRDRITVVTFHRVLPEQLRRLYPLPGLVVTPEELDWFLRYFAEHYACGPLTATMDRWASGEPSARPRLAITFDDAQLDNYVHALPVLERHGLLASFYAPVDHVESGEAMWFDRLAFTVMHAIETGEPARSELARHLPVPLVDDRTPVETARDVLGRVKGLTDGERTRMMEAVDDASGARPVPEWAGMMTWEHLRALYQRGHEIGSHSMSHPILPRCDDGRLEHEVRASRERLEEALDATVSSFCYPNGDCDERVARQVERAGYRYAVTTRHGTNRRGASELELRRCDMTREGVAVQSGEASEARLAWRLSPMSQWLLDAEDAYRRRLR